MSHTWKQIWLTGHHAKAAYPLAVPIVLGGALCAWICGHNMATDRSFIFWKSKAPVYTDTPLITESEVNSHKGILKPTGYMQARVQEAIQREQQWAQSTGASIGAARFGGIPRANESDVEL
eukprot:TRINITY_DN945_c0_g1_i1.p2 TRINITY_DN945_c0_g1~~TRINITY_DN945_c0_g1_i1.p2  ORF type:complete len:135 (+),score=33.34 TRINITY_DN945_c0_g1_i1:44-406(+)